MGLHVEINEINLNNLLIEIIEYVELFVYVVCVSYYDTFLQKCQDMFFIFDKNLISFEVCSVYLIFPLRNSSLMIHCILFLIIL